MNNFIYENRTKVYFGQGCGKRIPCLPGQRCRGISCWHTGRALSRETESMMKS